MRSVKILNISNPVFKPITATWSKSFLEKFVGLMFKKELKPDGSIIIDQGVDSTIGSAIHMLFMNFSIAAIWVNSDLTVVDTKIAKPWKLAYFPQKPARYIIETSTNTLVLFKIGDQLKFDDA